MKTQSDLGKLIPHFKVFCNFLINHPRVIDKGRIAEYYCELLFNLDLQPKINDDFDAKDSRRKKIEIKQRDFASRVPPGMRIDLDKFDYLLYVSLGEDLLPDEILRFDSDDIEVNPKNKRASFTSAFNSGKYRKIYARKG